MATIREYAGNNYYEDSYSKNYEDSYSKKYKEQIEKKDDKKSDTDTKSTTKKEKTNPFSDPAASLFDKRNEADKAKNENPFLAGLGGSLSLDGAAFSLSDYAMIKNGTYGKLLKSYYAKDKADAASKNKDTAQQALLTESSANALAKSVKTLMESVTSDKKSDEDKRKDMKKAMQSFVDDYNNALDNAANSNNTSVLRNAAWMTKTTSANKNLLQKVGLSVGAGNKLSFDEDAFDEADLESIKTLFSGQNSYASQIVSKANAVANATTGGMYSRNGSYAK